MKLNGQQVWLKKLYHVENVSLWLTGKEKEVPSRLKARCLSSEWRVGWVSFLNIQSPFRGRCSSLTHMEEKCNKKE